MNDPKVGDESVCTSCGHKIVFTGECWDHRTGVLKPKHPASPPGSPLAEHVETQPHAGQGTGYIEQLKQLFNGVRWDGDLLSKHHRNELVKNGLAAKANGWNLITEKGVTYLEELGLIQP